MSNYLTEAYKNVLKAIETKPELMKDALQEAYISASKRCYDNVEHATNALKLQTKHKYIDLVRKYSNMDSRALDWRESATSSERYLEFQNDAKALLTAKQSEVLDYVLSGYRYKEIAEILETGTVAISKMMKRIVDKFKIRYTDLTEVALFEGNKGYFSENDLIYFIDNSARLQEA